jgi:hypothetical protein
MDAALIATPPIPDQGSAPKSQFGLPTPVLSDDLKAKISAPFAAVARGLKSTAPGKPGNTSGNGSPVSTRSRSATLAPPVARPVAQTSRQDVSQARDAQLVVARIEPWSVLKFSFIISLVGFVVLLVAVAALYFLLKDLGVFHSIEKTVGLVTSSKGNAGSNAASWFSAGTILGYTAIAGLIDVVLITALSTFGAVIYNLVTRITGGVEVTLQESD